MSLIRRHVLLIAFLSALTAVPCARAYASSGDELAADTAVLAQFEEHALHADVREQCFLYTQLAKGYSELASRQIAAGEMEQATISLKHLEHATTLVQGALSGNAKRLKEAEMMMHMASFRLGEVIRYVSNEDRARVQSALRQLNKVNEQLLAQVFAH